MKLSSTQLIDLLAKNNSPGFADTLKRPPFGIVPKETATALLIVLWRVIALKSGVCNAPLRGYGT
jgi:hypothetical protein